MASWTALFAWRKRAICFTRYRHTAVKNGKRAVRGNLDRWSASSGGCDDLCGTALVRWAVVVATQLSDLQEQHALTFSAPLRASGPFGYNTRGRAGKRTAVLNCSLAEMTGDETASSPEWSMIRGISRGRREAELVAGQAALAGMFEALASQP